MDNHCCVCGVYLSDTGRMICQNCEKKQGKGIKFERIRRITGYLVGTLDKWNDAKKSEEKDRVKHGVKSYDKR